MPLHIAFVLSLALHLAAYTLADWAGLRAPPPPTPPLLIEAALILPEIAVEPPAEEPPAQPPPEAPPSEPPVAQPPVAQPPPPPPPPVATAAPAATPQAVLKPAEPPPQFYPHEAVRNGLEGEVLVAVTLDGRGRVLAARLERGSGHAILDEAAVRAALSLRSMPGGSGETLLPVSFRLR